jgi:hypothetical protein
MPRPCRSHAMPQPCLSESDLSRPRHGAPWEQHGMCELASAVQRWHAGVLPAFGFFQLQHGVPWRLLPEVYQSQMQFGYFRLPRGLSRRRRHCRRMTGARQGNIMGTAWYVWISLKSTNIHSEYVKYLSLFHYNNCFKNAARCYIFRTLPVLLQYVAKRCANISAANCEYWKTFQLFKRGCMISWCIEQESKTLLHLWVVVSRLKLTPYFESKIFYANLHVIGWRLSISCY